MSDTHGRLAALSGLLIAACVAIWWLGSTRLALDSAADASRAAAAALQLLWLARALVLVLQGLRIGALHGWRVGGVAALVMVAPAWPVVALAWSASNAAWTRVALGEALLVLAGPALALAGQGLRRLMRRVDLAEALATVLAATLATALWFTRGAWALPPA
ncbi:MAG: hypothetical protein JNK55_14960 [Rubrivivax sp.]|nr:hypothetical protein [Rubrivivax sp.]